MVVSKFSTPAEASQNADSASWICLLMDLMLRVKLSLFNDSDTTRSRSVSLMPAHLISGHNESAFDGAEHKKSSFSLLLKKCYF